MEELYSLVRNLAVILLLASFIEMLLPSKSMQGFVRLVMGLFVISAILTPITSLLRMPMEMSIPAWTETSTGDMPVLASGEEGMQISQNAVQEKYKMIIENQIKAVVLNVSGVKSADIEIEMSGGTGLTDQPKIEQINVYVNSEQQEVKPVEEVAIGEAPAEKKEPSLFAQEIKSKVATFIQIQTDKVFVHEVS